jgi:acylphosphatase
MPLSNQAAVKVIVHGKVQRVFFRLSTRMEARNLGLTGTVRNLPGGKRVEVVAEGEKSRLESLIAYLKHGPEHAEVDTIEIEWLDYTGRFNEFDVVY